MKKLLQLLIILNSLYIVSQDLNTDLLIHYTFNGDLNDSSGNGFNGTNFGATYTDDRHGNENSAIYFDGVNDFISMPNLAQLKPNLPVSFSFWIKYDDYSSLNSDLFNTSFEEDKSSGVFFTLQSSTNNYSLAYGDGGNNYIASTRRTYNSNRAAEINEWTHLVLVVNSALDMKIYVNCVDYGGTTSGSGGNLFYSTTAGNLGRHDRSISALANYFKGSLDDFKYWGRALSSQEVSNELCTLLSIRDIKVSNEEPKIYPNPTSNILNIKEGTQKIEKICVFDAFGRQVSISNYQMSIDMSSLSNGVYFVKTYFNIGFYTKKIILIK
ncbi:LamG-like jellyroll fold domain-containing protein [uncultured Algibacter sp.]|uniref:LamG-like jellyroll fold domain-containing protein n=1 Tax=uncultured Algibacter sp. TaxID=298659 RepID=UPI00260A44BB|nr:LamG-like jellyroll fold domain-containing protein [uncultured Algibacter sp.]